MLKKVELLSTNGYKNEQNRVLEWLEKKGLTSMQAKLDKLQQHILVKEDKPSNCYTFHKLLDNLKQRSAEEVVVAIRSRPEGLKSTNGWEEIFSAPTR